MKRSIEENAQLYAQLSPRADMEYMFAIFYGRYMNKLRDYGNGMLINMVEVHTLTMIADQPGITANELAKQWRRTKGAVSQNRAKLEEKGLICKKRSENDSRNLHLYVTSQGQELSDLHKRYDVDDLLSLRSYLLSQCSEDELESFYKVLEIYLQTFLDSMDDNGKIYKGL